MKKLIVMSADALVWEDMEYLSSLPNFQKYLAGGAGIRQVRSVYPTITYPCHATMSTGVYPDKHGVTGNLEFHPGQAENLPWLWDYKYNLWKTDIFTEAKKAGYRTAAVFWPVTGNHPAIDYLIDEYWIQSPTDTPREAFARMGSSEEMIQIVEKNTGDVNRPLHPQLDTFIVDCACDIIRQYRPDVLFLHPADVDWARHQYGLFNDQVKKTVENTDQYIGKIMKAVGDAGILEETNLVLVSDHGQREIQKIVNAGLHRNCIRRMQYHTYQGGYFMSKRSMRTAALAMTVVAAVGTCSGIPVQAEGEKVTVNFWHSMGGDNEKLLQSVVDAYNASQDKVEVVPEYQGNYYDSIAKVQTAIGAGNGPDILQTGSGQISILAKEDGVLENLVPYMQESGMKNDFYEGFITGMSFDPASTDETLLGFPMGCSTPVMYCNDALLEEAGLQVPTTWDEMTQVAGTLIDEGKVEYGFALPHDPWYFWMFIAQNDTHCFSEDGSTFACVEDGTGIEMWQKVQNMVKDKVMYFGPAQDDNCSALFAEGKTAFIINSIGALTGIQNAVDFDFSVQFVPKEKVNSVPTGGNTLCMLASSEVKDAAWDFLHWMYTDNGGVATYSSSIGYLPCSETIADMDAVVAKREDPNYQKAFEQLPYANNEHMVRQPNNGDVANLVTAMMEATLYDFEDVTEQMQIMNEEATAVLKDLQ